jgi:protein TonB
VALAVLLLGNFFRPDPPKLPPGIKVNLVVMDSPAEDDKATIDEPAPPVQRDEPKVEPPEPEPVVEPPEPEPVVEPPEPEPVVEPPKPPPVVVPPKPQPVVVPPKPTPPVKKEPPKPKPEKTWKPTSIEEMRKRIANNKPTPPRPRVDVNDLARKIRAAAGVSISRPTTSRPVGDPHSTVREADFDAAVAGLVSRYWDKDFLASELDGPGREVLVKFIVAPNGRITMCRITKYSHVGAVDQRVAKALQKIKARGFPAPSKYGIRSSAYEVEVRFTVND